MKLFSIVVLIAAAGMVHAQPQQSENFRITKSVLDAGGGPSTSANFQLVSAFGQPTPIGLQWSENFVLSAGFLSPLFSVSPLSPIQELVIKRVGSDMQLWWEPIAGAESYNIYRSTNSLFTPDPGSLIGSATDTLYADTGAVNLEPVRHYYIVTSVNSASDPLARETHAKAQRTRIKQ